MVIVEKYQTSKTGRAIIASILVICCISVGGSKMTKLKEVYEEDKTYLQNPRNFSEWFEQGKLNNRSFFGFGVKNDVKISDATINRFIWYRTYIFGDFKNVVFRKGIFHTGELGHSNLENVTFKNVTFIDVSFDYSKMNNVKFINCKFKNLKQWRQESFNSIEFEDCSIKGASFKNYKGFIKVYNSISEDFYLTAKNNSAEIFIEGGSFDGVIRGSFSNLSMSELNFLRASVSSDNKSYINISNSNEIYVSVKGTSKELLIDNIENACYISVGYINSNIKINNITSGKSIVAATLNEVYNKNLSMINVRSEKMIFDRFEGDIFLDKVSVGLWTQHSSKIRSLYIKNLTMLKPIPREYDNRFHIDKDPNKNYFLNLKNSTIEEARIEGFKPYPGVNVDMEGTIIRKAVKVLSDGTEESVTNDQKDILFN